MARNTSITLGDHVAGFVDTQVAAGRFGSASEVVRAGLRLLEEHEAKVQALRDHLADGARQARRGEFVEFCRRCPDARQEACIQGRQRLSEVRLTPCALTLMP